MMSGAVWGCDRLAACGWEMQIAEPRKVKALAPLARKTDRVDARVLAELVRRDLVPEVWVPALSERELRERLRRRAHLVRLRTSATNRAFGLLTQWGLRVSLTTLRKSGALEQLSERGVPPIWLESIKTLLSVIDDLDRQIAPIERELRPLAYDNEQVQLLMTIPGVAELLVLTLLAEIADISRFPTARRLVGYSGLAPTIKQSGQGSRTGNQEKPICALQSPLTDSNRRPPPYHGKTQATGRNHGNSFRLSKLFSALCHLQPLATGCDRWLHKGSILCCPL